MDCSVKAAIYGHIVSEKQAQIPRVNSTRYGLRSFRYEAARIWNSLPNELRLAESYPQFRRLLRAWDGLNYFKLAFYLDDRYLSSEDTAFVELAQADLNSFQQDHKLDRVLLFPPVNNYLRLLIHKTVESYPPLHSFSVGEGAGRQTVVCWKQALVSPELEDQTMSAARPPSSRGRGRGILRDYHSQSPGPRSDEDSTQRSSSTDNARQDGGTARSERRERPERKTRRPDVQVYVPRGRRLQVQSSRSPQTDDRTLHSKPDDTTGDSQRPVARGQRYSSSPQQRPVRSSPQGPGRVAASAIGSILKGQTNTSRLDLNTTDNVNKDKLGTNDFTCLPVTKSREVTDIKKTGETDKNSVELALVRVRDDVCEMNQTNDDEIIESDHHRPSNESVYEPVEKAILKHSNEMEEDNKIEAISRLDKSNDKERCIKKIKISETADHNVNNSLENDSNICDDEKLSQHLHSEMNNFEMNLEPSAPSDLNSKWSQQHCTNNHNVIDYESKSHDRVEKDLEYQNGGLNLRTFKTCTAGELLESGENCMNENISIEPEQDKFVPNCIASHPASDSKLISNDDNSLVMNDSCVAEKGETPSGCSSEWPSDKTLPVENNLGDDQHVHQQMQGTIKESDKEPCDIDRRFCDPGDIDAKEIDNTKMEYSSSSTTNNVERDCMSVEQAFNEQPCDKLDILTSHESASDNLPENNMKVSNEILSNTKTDHTACDESLDTVEHSEQSDVLEIDTKQCANSNINSDANAQEDGENSRQDTLDGDRNDEIQCHPMMAEEPPVKPVVDMTAKRVIVYITPDQSELLTVKSPDTIDQSEEQPHSGGDESDEETWDTMFDDNGDCLDPSAMEELTRTVGKVKIQKSKKINYLDYKPKDKSAELDYTEYGHIIEIYDFPPEFVTRDLIMAFQAFMSRGFDLKWVDDTHALGVFSSSIAAQDALNIMHPLLKVCPLSQASSQSKAKARRCTEFLQPYKPRPETSAVAARRLVAGALGLQSRVPKEKRDKERQQLKEAKAKRRQDRQAKDDIWEGRLGKCAMDDES